MPNCSAKLILLLALVAVAYSFPASAQIEEGHEPILVDEFSRLSDCDFRSRIDSFLADISAHPGQHGYIINYKPVKELPGAKDVYARETMIRDHIVFRQFDPARITFIRGGYREDHRTLLYRVPVGIAPPEPSEGLPAPKISDDKTMLYDSSVLGLAYGVGDEGGGGTDLEEFVLESVKMREAAEQAALEAELDSEDPGAEPDPQNAAEAGESEGENNEPSGDGEPVNAEPVSKEQLEAERFEWAEVSLPKFMSTRKKATGVLIFYADDQRYDIAKLKAFIEQGRDRMAEKAGMKASLFRVEFGGYRESVEVEFWFVPLKGRPPVPTPEERKPDEPEPTDIS